jgi:hypothetical protein
MTRNDLQRENGRLRRKIGAPAAYAECLQETLQTRSETSGAVDARSPRSLRLSRMVRHGSINPGTAGGLPGEGLNGLLSRSRVDRLTPGCRQLTLPMRRAGD